MAIASVASIAQTAGYPALFLLVMAESGGIPLPGETALITAAIVASQGKLQIELVIAIAALAAIVGDNIGYLISRRFGPTLLERPGPFERRRRQVLEIGQPFFARHGPKAVFIGRWILGLRTWASWLAGASGMPWRSFALWNAAGGISWAITVGLVAYFVGNTATGAITAFGLFGLLVVVFAGVGALLLRRLRPD
jgi:membrane-associated protein